MKQIIVHCCEHTLHSRYFPLIGFALGHIVQYIVRIANCRSLTGHCAVLQVAKAVSHSLNNCVNCLPGQKDVDMALRSIGEASKKLLIDMVCIDTKTSVQNKYIYNRLFLFDLMSNMSISLCSN